MDDDKRRDPAGTQGHWLTTPFSLRRKTPTVRALAGHPLEIDARKLLEHDLASGRVIWIVAGRRLPGSVLKWTPASPGPFRAHIEVDGRRIQTISILVGVQQQDIIDLRERLNFFFCLIVRHGATVSFLPLFAPSKPGRGKGKRDRGALDKEAGGGHRALAAWTRRQTSIYRRTVLPRPFFDVGCVADGLYAIFPNDVVYLGGARPVAAAAAEIKAALRDVRVQKKGGGQTLRRIEKLAATLKPFEYRYSAKVQYPIGGARARTANTFVFRAIAPLVGAASRFATAIGSRVGPGQATAVVSFNVLNGTIGTRVIDSQIGVSRHLVSGFDVLLSPDQLVSLGQRLTDRGIDVTSFAGFTTRAQTLPTDSGGSVTALGLSPLGRVGAESAAAEDGGDADPVGDVKANGVESQGKIWVQGSDGSTIGFSKDANGDPIVHVIGTTDDGGVIVTGDDTVIDFTDPPSGDGGDGGDGTDGGTDGGDGTSPDGGDPGDGTDGGTPDGGGGDTGGGDDSGGDDGGGDDGGDGTDGGTDGGGGPTTGDPTASMTAPDDGGGDTGGGRGPSGDPLGPGSGDGSSSIYLGRLGVITTGGGYTDPAPDDTGGEGGGEGGPIRIVSGGGVSDPPDENGGGGFDFWGSFHPPTTGGGIDPTVASLGGYGEAGAGPQRNAFSTGTVSVTSYGGTDANGVPLDGLVGCGMAQPGRGPKP